MKVITIEIKKCVECPHLDYIEAFTKSGLYRILKPCCNNPDTVKAKGNSHFRRIIPYEQSHKKPQPVYVPKKIPKWCPLSDKRELPYPLSSAHEMWQIAREMTHDEYVTYYNKLIFQKSNENDCDASEVDLY